MMLSTTAEQLTLQFYTWELKCRGWQVFAGPVDPEPAFEPFFSHRLPTRLQHIDDGRRPTLFSSLARSVRNLFAPKVPELKEETILAYPFVFDSPLQTFTIVFPKGYKVQVHETEQLLLMLGSCQCPVSFEIIALEKLISVQYTCSQEDAGYLVGQLKAHFPQATIIERADALVQIFSGKVEVIDLALQDEFMRPVATAGTFDPDPLISLFGFLEHFNEGDGGAIQVIFRGSVNAWAESVLRSVTTEDGNSFFADAPDMLPLARQKIAAPLYGVIIRAIGMSISPDSADAVAWHIATALKHLSRSAGNVLIPLTNDYYPYEKHCEDVLLRQTHRLGMLLNSRELATMVHFPSASVISAKLERDAKKTKAAPGMVVGHPLVFGSNSHQGKQITVSLSNEQRLRHTHIIGATGTGKSTLLQQLIVQDIEQGNGIAVLDPHGDLIEKILGYIPERRSKDVLIIDPGDVEYPVGFNILSAHSDIEKDILSSDLVTAFRRQSTAWGDQMNSVFANAIVAFLESTRRGTLADLRRFLIDQQYRNEFLKTVQDPGIRYYWQKEYPLLKSSSLGSILTRLDSFLRPKLIRNMVSQQRSIDFNTLMSEKKIILIKLSQGLIGEENSYLLGTFIVSKLYQAAMSRQIQTEGQRSDFFLYIDEFQHFITSSMSSILSGARKYHLGLTVSHQSMNQLQRSDTELAGAVIANAGTRICFRLGDTDARNLEDGFSFFEAKDLQNLAVGEAIMRVDRSENDFSLTTFPLNESGISKGTQAQIIAHSRATYATSKDEVEAALAKAMQMPEEKELFTPAITPVANTEEVVVRASESIQQNPTSAPTQPPEKIKIKPIVENSIIKKEETQHRYLQTLIKKAAESKGYRAFIEKLTPDGAGKVDVSLEKGESAIAVEISVTTDAQWEIHNIKKCISAGYTTILLCVADSKAKNEMKKKVLSAFDSSHEQKIMVVDAEELLYFIDQEQEISNSTETREKGYRVKVKYESMSQEDMNKKRESIAKIVLTSMKKMKK